MESFILQDYIDESICDELIEAWEANSEKSRFDKVRGYHRLNDNDIENTDLINRYIRQVVGVEQKYRKKFPFINSMTKWGLMSPFNLQKYEPGYSYSPLHIEDGGPKDGKMQRILTFTTYLNDVEVDGETEFVTQGIKVKPKKGLTVIFPAQWTHPHRGIAAPNEVKYIVTGWFTHHFRSKKIG
jgi:hypothetical protein